MAKTRKTAKVIKLITVEQFEESLAIYAAADAREQKINATMDEQFTKIREKYQRELEDLKANKESNFTIVMKYCEDNQDELFTDRKSLETVHGLVGFRTGTPKLKPLRPYTWASVLELLKVKAPKYVRTKEEPNKELLLADREDEDLQLLMPKIGVEVVQEEAFFIDLKKEEA